MWNLTNWMFNLSKLFPFKLIVAKSTSVLQSPTYSRWIPVDSKHNISFLEHLNWFGVYLVHLVKCGYALEVI
jgi:hypothetical protein